METKLATDEKPSFFTKDTALGLLVGALALSALAIAAPAIGLGTLTAFAAGAVGGGLVGGAVGHARMSREAVEGKTVKEPSLLNKKALIGGLAGWIGGNIATSLAGTALAHAGFVAAGAALTGGTGLLIGGLVLAAIGLIKGATSGKDDMQRDLEAAQMQQAQQQELSQARSRQQEQSAPGASVPDNTPPAQTVAAAATAADMAARAASATPDNGKPAEQAPPAAATPDQPITIVISPDGKHATVLPANAKDAAAPATPEQPAGNTTVVAENSPISSSTVINADGATAVAPDHSHVITNNNYTTVITATPQDGTAIVNTAPVPPTEPQPAAPQPVSPTPPQTDAADPATPAKPKSIVITITAGTPQQVAQAEAASAATDAAAPEGKFTSAILNERQQQPIVVTVEKGPGKSYTSNITAERQQPATQVNAV